MMKKQNKTPNQVGKKGRNLGFIALQDKRRFLFPLFIQMSLKN